MAPQDMKKPKKSPGKPKTQKTASGSKKSGGGGGGKGEKKKVSG